MRAGGKRRPRQRTIGGQSAVGPPPTSKNRSTKGSEVTTAPMVASCSWARNLHTGAGGSGGSVSCGVCRGGSGSSGGGRRQAAGRSRHPPLRFFSMLGSRRVLGSAARGPGAGQAIDAPGQEAATAHALEVAEGKRLHSAEAGVPGDATRRACRRRLPRTLPPRDLAAPALPLLFPQVLRPSVPLKWPLASLPPCAVKKSMCHAWRVSLMRGIRWHARGAAASAHCGEPVDSSSGMKQAVDCSAVSVASSRQRAGDAFLGDGRCSTHVLMTCALRPGLYRLTREAPTPPCTCIVPCVGCP